MNAYTLLNDLREAIDGIEALGEKDKLPPAGVWWWREFSETIKRAEALRNEGPTVVEIDQATGERVYPAVRAIAMSMAFVGEARRE